MKFINVDLTPGVNVSRKYIPAKFFWGINLNMILADPAVDEQLVCYCFDEIDLKKFEDISNTQDAQAFQQSCVGSCYWGCSVADGADSGVKQTSLILPEGVQLSKGLCIIVAGNSLESAVGPTIYFS